VYGSDAARAANLRSFVDGKMDVVNTPVGPMLPRNTGGLPNDNGSKLFPDAQLFLAGGKRASMSLAWPVLWPIGLLVGNVAGLRS
jgi:hypothetical protein